MSLGYLHLIYHCRICNSVSIRRLPKTVVLQWNRSATWLASRHAVRVPLRQTAWNNRQLRNWPVWSSSKYRLLSPRHGLGTMVVYLTVCGVSGAVGYAMLKSHYTPVTTHSKTTVQHNNTASVEVIDDEYDTSVVSGSRQISEGDLSLLQRLHLVFRFFYLFICFSPSVVLCGLGYLFGARSLSQLGWNYLLFVLQNAGPAFVKLGQWASTRRDLFSEDFCHAMSQLHTRCDPHPWNETVKIINNEFGDEWEKWLAIPSHKPIGSGCVAQVYQGYLKPSHQTRCEMAVETDGDENRTLSSLPKKRCIPIAVKVLHPGIVEAMDRDIRLMKYMAAWVDYLYPDVYWIALRECVSEFTVIMEKQVW